MKIFARKLQFRTLMIVFLSVLSSSVRFSAAQDNQPPTIDTVLPQVVEVGQSITIAISYSDADGDTLSVIPTSDNSAVASVALTTPQTLTVSGAAAGTATITVSVDDGRGGTASITFLVTVNSPPPPPNQPPVIDSITPQAVQVGQSITIAISYSDADGDTLSVISTSDNSAVASVALTTPQTLTVSGVAAGTATITVSVDDGRGGTASITFLVTVNSPPAITRVATIIEVGQSVKVAISYGDPDGDTLTVVPTSDNSAVATVILSGPQELTVTGVAPGTADITIRVDDGRGGTTNTTFPVMVKLSPPPPPPNQPPIIEPISPQTVEIGQSITVGISYNDPDSDPVTIIASSDKTDVATVTLPTTNQLAVTGVAVGSANITVTISDDKGGTNSTTFSVTVVNSPTIMFGAGGDIGANSRSDASLRAIAPTGAAFFLALGDMDYDETASDAAWCDYVKQRVGSTFPFEIVTGNHEEGSASSPGQDGYIGNHAACLPDRLGVQGLIPGQPSYPANYYFDYPQSSPLLRVIMISADLKYDGVQYNFNRTEQTNYNALAGRIDEAKQAGLWVVVGVHKVCLTVGQKTCEIGADLMNLLIEKKVDLVLQGHDHNYQRSKQIGLGVSCASVVPGVYNPNCVVDDGSDNSYSRGSGTVFVINGNMGRCCYTVQANDSEAGYMAKMVGVDGVNTNGFVVYTVSASRIDARVVNSVGNWSDAFSIIR